MLTFLTAVSLGKASEEDIDDWVERWHTDPELDMPLHEYLGMTREEYYQWAKDPDAIRSLLQLPRHGTSPGFPPGPNLSA